MPKHILIFNMIMIPTLHLCDADFGSLDEFKKRLGIEPKVNNYRPDLFPTSYEFYWKDKTVSISPIDGRVKNIEVFFKKAAGDAAISDLLRRETEMGEWELLKDKELIEKNYPLFNKTDTRNEFFATKDRKFVALVQRGVAMGELVFFIQCADYLEQLNAYRKAQKK